ncbi:MAG: hypothetical protein WA813_08035, partial [Beijerinckiaceae bacterium]
CYRDPCCGACHFAMRRHRLAMIPQACELFDDEEEKHQVNIVHPSWAQPRKHLDGARPEAAKQWVRRRLEKLGRPIRAVGSFEVTLNVELDGTRHWAGEVVMIIAGARKEHIASVLKLRTRDKKRLQPHAKPIKFSSVKNLARQIGYANKRYLEQRIAYIDGQGRQNRKHWPLDVSDGDAADAWLAGMGIFDRDFHVGCGWRAGKLALLPRRLQSMKRRNDFS